MKSILVLFKFNLLWLFKYRCKIPPGVWFAIEHIENGTPVYIVNDRLHLLRSCLPDMPEQVVYGLVSNSETGLRVITQGHFENCNMEVK